MSFVEETDPLWQEIEGIVRDEGLYLYDFERMTSAQLRVAIAAVPNGEPHATDSRAVSPEAGTPDAANSEAADAEAAEAQPKRGVTSGDCSRIVRRLMTFFKAEGHRWGVIEEPEIEVSSPGLARHLRLPLHFRGAVGEKVKVVCFRATPVGAVITGTLAACDGEQICIEPLGATEQVTVPLGEVKKAQVEFSF